MLNALFEGEMVITDIAYRNKELLPSQPEGKKIIYDIYCTSKEGHHFILEMQQVESENFPGRLLFYASRAIVDQGIKGIEYDLDPVYCIVLADFYPSNLSHSLVHDIRLYDGKTRELYTDQIRLIILTLPELPKIWEECNNELVRQLFLIKNMGNMTKESTPYTEGRYRELFADSSVNTLSEEQAISYKDSYFRDLENRSAINFASQRSLEKGIKEGVLEGIKQTARNLLKMGFSLSDISKATGLSSEAIAGLS